jgi:hypothetical protein
MLVAALGASLMAFAGAGIASADEGDTPADAPQAVADAQPPEMGVSDYVNDDEMLPKEPTSDAMTALVSGVSSLLSECRPNATLISVQTIVNQMDTSASTLIVATRGESDRVTDEPLGDLLASCSKVGGSLTSSIMASEVELFALM